MPKWKRPGWAMAFALVCGFSPAALAQDSAKAIATLKAVSREGAGNEAAGEAWKSLVKQGGVALSPALAAIDDANPTAANWLRTAVGAIAERERESGAKLPADKLEAFARDTQFAPSARRIAYELLIAQEPQAAERLLPGFLNDPSPDLRRDAVASELAKLEKAAGPTIQPQLEKLLALARDKDQVELIAKKLEDDYKAKVSITENFGFLTRWHLVGPFDSAKGKALTLSHPPEKAMGIAGKFQGKGGAEVVWKPAFTTDRYGFVDLNKLVNKEKDAAVYALAIVEAPAALSCEIRVGTPNTIQIFLNGEKLFEREEYHHGSGMDLNIGKGHLKAGPNVIVLKVCQNNQSESWAQDWKFQLRLCDSTGGKLPGVKQLIPNEKGFEPVVIGSIPSTEEKK